MHITKNHSKFSSRCTCRKVYTANRTHILFPKHTKHAPKIYKNLLGYKKSQQISPPHPPNSPPKNKTNTSKHTNHSLTVERNEQPKPLLKGFSWDQCGPREGTQLSVQTINANSTSATSQSFVTLERPLSPAASVSHGKRGIRKESSPRGVVKIKLIHVSPSLEETC